MMVLMVLTDCECHLHFALPQLFPAFKERAILPNALGSGPLADLTASRGLVAMSQSLRMHGHQNRLLDELL